MVGMNRLSLAGGLRAGDHRSGGTLLVSGLSRSLHRRTGDLVSRSRWPTGHDLPARILRARWSSLTGWRSTGQNEVPATPGNGSSETGRAGSPRTTSRVAAQYRTILSRLAESSDRTSANPRPR